MMTSNKEAKEVIEGLMKGLSRFRRFIFVNSTLADLYNHAIPALEKAQEFLDGLDGQDCPVEDADFEQAIQIVAASEVDDSANPIEGVFFDERDKPLDIHDV